MNETVEVVIEVPRGSRNQYQIDEEAGAARLRMIAFQ